jgi:hypothetical protein
LIVPMPQHIAGLHRKPLVKTADGFLSFWVQDPDFREKPAAVCFFRGARFRTQNAVDVQLLITIILPALGQWGLPVFFAGDLAFRDNEAA